MAPLREENEALSATGSYMVDLADHAHQLENEAMDFHRTFDQATARARQYYPQCLALDRENYTLHRQIQQLQNALDTTAATLIRVEKERANLNEVLIHTMDDKRKLHATLDKLQQEMEEKDDHLTVSGHLLGVAQAKVKELEANREHNAANIVVLIRTALYLQNKAKMLLRTWKDEDSFRVDELQEVNSELPPESQRAIRKENFTPYPTSLKLHLCPFEDMPTPVETPEVWAAQAMVDKMFTSEHTPEDRYLVPYKKARTEESA